MVVSDVPDVVLVVRGPPTGPVGAPMVASRAVWGMYLLWMGDLAQTQLIGQAVNAQRSVPY